MKFRRICTIVALALTPFPLLGFAAQAQFGRALRLSRDTLTPEVAFAAVRPPAAPDYARPSAWIALPSTRDDADVTPAGVREIDQSSAPADVFFLYPTVLTSQTVWNADTNDAALNAKIAATAIRNQASVFNGCCAVYAPRYRQMTLGGYVSWSEDSAAATELAYGDVARAFRQFLAWNRGRPFIIAGHSQGSRLARLLIEREIDGRPAARRMVAAYLLGHWIATDWYRGLRDVRPCRRADDIGCVVNWSTYADGRDAALQRIASARRSGYAPEAEPRAYGGINPFTWSTRDDVAPRELDRGSWVHGPGEAPRAIQPGLVSARMSDGALYISPPGEPYASLAIPFGNFHNIDYNIAYMNIRENASVRVAAFDRR